MNSMALITVNNGYSELKIIGIFIIFKKINNIAKPTKLLKNIICKIDTSLDKILTSVSCTEKTVIPAIM